MDILVPTETFVVWHEGRLVRFRTGRTTVRQGHPLTAGEEHRFRPLSVDFDIAQAPKAQAGPAAGAPAEFVCPHCGKTAGSAIGLASHVRAKHPDA